MQGLDFSPVKGPEGNIEYLIYLQKGLERQEEPADVAAVVAKAHSTLA